LKVTAGERVAVSFTVKNTGSRAGKEIAEVYAGLPARAGEPPKRLVGWSRVKLDPGESKDVSVELDALFLSVFDTAHHAWSRPPGGYTIMVGGSSVDLPLREKITLE